jgi:Cys-tRNA(Pro)/Cys-tRNA(Cys) deacylase
LNLKKEVSIMEEKTNVMRILEQKKIKYTAHSYINTDAVSGVDVAAALNENPDKVFKTLVTVAKSGKNYVFVIPVAKELDLKKAARAVGEKLLRSVKIIFAASSQARPIPRSFTLPKYSVKRGN